MNEGYTTSDLKSVGAAVVDCEQGNNPAAIISSGHRKRSEITAGTLFVADLRQRSVASFLDPSNLLFETSGVRCSSAAIRRCVGGNHFDVLV
jgi:hypothetical protein